MGACLELIAGQAFCWGFRGKVVVANLGVRRATEQDLSAIGDLLVRSFHLYPPGGEVLIPLVRVGIQGDLRMRFQGKFYRCLVAIDPIAGLVGTVEISQRVPLPWQLSPLPYVYLANLAVRSDQRRCGVAQALIKASEEYISTCQYRDLYLHVMEDNRSARQLYLKAGYYIHQAENDWNAYLGLPRRLFLHKRLIK
jgi:ribosomal protein S18 acetylase RimI-like enzyme